jgi:hypothetical protein
LAAALVCSASPRSPTTFGPKFARYAFRTSRGVALRVDRHEDRLQAIAVGAELGPDLRQLGHRRRADVGALRVAEEDDDDLAVPVGEAARLAVGVGQLELARELGAGDVGEVEGRLGADAGDPVAAAEDGDRADRERASGRGHATTGQR